MDLQFISKLMEELDFPPEARQTLSCSAKELEKSAADKVQAAKDFFYQNDFPWKETQAQFLIPASQETRIHQNTVDLLFLLECCKPLRKLYQDKGYSDARFLETMSDLRCKLLESWDVYGVWGTFVGFWYPIFFQLKLHKLGRLEYETAAYDRDTPYEKHGIRLKKGSPVKSIHIPSSGPLPEQACLDSYRQAYAFYKDELEGGLLICVCHSWLLHPSTRAILPTASNTVRFLSDFDIIEVEDTDAFDDKWRVFGSAHEQSVTQLPEDTSMRKAYKDYLLRGGKTGHGYGVLIFDGEKLLT